MGVVIPWFILMSYQTYRYGIKPQQLPEPYHYIWGSAAMVVAGIAYQASPRVGTLLAWGLLIGALIASNTLGKQEATKQ